MPPYLMKKLLRRRKRRLLIVSCDEGRAVNHTIGTFEFPVFPPMTSEVRVMPGSIDRQIWRDPESGLLWAIEIMEGHVVGRAGPMHDRELDLDLDTLRFERDSGCLREMAERRQRYR